MAGNNANKSINNSQNTNNGKVMTKYDRKVAKRKEEEKRLQREKIIFRAVTAGIIAGILIAAVVICSMRYYKIHKGRGIPLVVEKGNDTYYEK